MEAALGSNDVRLASVLNGLANIYFSEHKFSKAETLYIKTLSLNEKALGPDHPDLAASLNNLANFYTHRGEFEKAEPLFMRALEIAKKNYQMTIL